MQTATIIHKTKVIVYVLSRRSYNRAEGGVANSVVEPVIFVYFLHSIFHPYEPVLSVKATIRVLSLSLSLSLFLSLSPTYLFLSLALQNTFVKCQMGEHVPKFKHKMIKINTTCSMLFKCLHSVLA